MLTKTCKYCGGTGDKEEMGMTTFCRMCNGKGQVYMSDSELNGIDPIIKQSLLSGLTDMKMLEDIIRKVVKEQLT